MKILIIGAGETGYYIAHELSQDGQFEVTLIDENPSHLEKAQRSLNVAGVAGNGTSLSVLETAGIAEADLVVACTDHDETNLICCLLAHNYDVGYKIAVTRTDSFLKRKRIQRYQRGGVDQVINSSVVAAQEIVATANLASATEISMFGERNVVLVGYKVKENFPWRGKALKDVRQSAAQRFLLASIVREGESFIPKGDDIIQEKDYIYLLLPKADLDSLEILLGVKVMGNRKAVIVGGGYTAQRVALGLLHSHYDVTLACDDPQRYLELKKKFEQKKGLTLVLGDASLVRQQLKMDVATAALFVAVTKNDSYNIACGMTAKYLGARKTICLVNRQDLLKAADLAGIDQVVTPRLTTARQVKKAIQGEERDVNFTTISETDMEVREMVLGEHSPIAGLPLMEVTLPEGSLVGALVEPDGEVIIPTGQTVIHPGDRVIMVTTPVVVPRLKELIEGVEEPA